MPLAITRFWVGQRSQQGIRGEEGLAEMPPAALIGCGTAGATVTDGEDCLAVWKHLDMARGQ